VKRLEKRTEPWPKTPCLLKCKALACSESFTR
jgi:hypothetical protein